METQQKGNKIELVAAAIVDTGAVSPALNKVSLDLVDTAGFSVNARDLCQDSGCLLLNVVIKVAKLGLAETRGGSVGRGMAIRNVFDF